MSGTASVRVIRSDERAKTTTDWLESRHSFSFGDHYDPDNTHHGLLLACNEDVVAPGAGFDTHRHRDMEVVTWLLSGTLVHRDSDGHSGVIYPGLVQRMSAGSGTAHSERNDTWADQPGSGTDPAHLIQMWVIPDTVGGEPGYQQCDVNAALGVGGLVTVASGNPEHQAAITIGNRDAALHVGRLAAGDVVAVPAARYAHVFVAVGDVTVDDGNALRAGDAIRYTDAGARQLTAVSSAEVLVWEMHRGLTDPAGAT